MKAVTQQLQAPGRAFQALHAHQETTGPTQTVVILMFLSSMAKQYIWHSNTQAIHLHKQYIISQWLAG